MHRRLPPCPYPLPPRLQVATLRTLVQARQGRYFGTTLSTDLQTMVTEYTDQLMADGLIAKLLGGWTGTTGTS